MSGGSGSPAYFEEHERVLGPKHDKEEEKKQLLTLPGSGDVFRFPVVLTTPFHCYKKIIST